jgi:hypothetical protein
VEAGQVAGETFGMCHQKMRKENWLGMLHVSHAGHGDFQAGFGLKNENVDECTHNAAGFRSRINDEQAEIRGDELVAAAAGVELPTERAEFLDKRFFNEMMDIFGSGTGLVDPSRVVFGAFGDFIEPRDRLPDFGFREYSGSLQGFGPGTIDRNLVRQETTVERKRALESVEMRVGRGFEAATPEAIVLSFNHSSPKRSPCRLEVGATQDATVPKVVAEKGRDLLRPSEKR